MAFPNAPTEGGGAKIHFLDADANTAHGWVAVETGTTGTGSNAIGWAGVATHADGDELTDPGDITTSAAPVVLIAGYDQTDVHRLEMASNGDLKITLDSETVQLGAGSAAIGKLAANSGVDIGDVDVLSLPALAAGTNAIGKLVANDGVDIGDVTINNAAGSGVYVRAGTGATWDVSDRAARDMGKVDIAAFDVALPTGSNAIGKLAANNGVDIGDVTINNAAGSGVYVQPGTAATWDVGDRAARDLGKVDIAAFDVSLPAGTNAIGKLAANSGVDIGDVDVASIAAGSNIIGKVYISDGTDDALVDATGHLLVADGGQAITVDGAVKDDGPNYTVIDKFAEYTSAQTDTTLWDPAAGKKAVITDIYISCSAAVTAHLEHGTTVFWKGYFAANGGAVSNLRTPVKGATDENITITTSAGNVSILLTGYEE